MLRHSNQICGELTVDLLTNRKHLYEISVVFCIRQKCEQRNLEADVTSHVSGVVRIEIVVQKRCFYRRILLHITTLYTTFDRPQLSVSEGCCVFIGHEYIYQIQVSS